MDKEIKLTLGYIQELTKDWQKVASATESAATSLEEFIKQKKTNCGMKSLLAQHLLKLLGYKVELIRGYYLSPERWVLHTWIKVNGKEYDAARKNFKITKNHSYINPDPKLRSWEQILKNLNT